MLSPHVRAPLLLTNSLSDLISSCRRGAENPDKKAKQGRWGFIASRKLEVEVRWSVMATSYCKPGEKNLQALRDAANRLRIHSIRATCASNSG